MKKVFLKNSKSAFLLSAKVVVMVIAISLVATSCKKDKDDDKQTGGDVVVDDNGLTPDINNLISPEILAEIEGMGMPIYTGGNPPKDITGVYVSSPDICVATNVPNDYFGPGHQFADFYFNLSEQNNSQLTIVVATAQAAHTGDGTGAYIVGEGDKFTIFCPLNSHTAAYDHDYKNVVIFSGIFTADGIQDFYHSTFMLEGGGFEWGLIEDGQGRVIYDSDGMSEHATWPSKKSAPIGTTAGESVIK